MLEVADGSSTAEVAAKIGPGLARVAIAGRITREGHTDTVDVARPLSGDCDLRILTASDDDAESLLLLRHSTAHVMAEAVCKLFPEAKLVYGPPLEDGFYYDIDLARSITPDDFPRIEEEMARIVAQDRPFCRHETSRIDAMKKLRDEGNRYKVENAERAEGDSLSFYVTGKSRGSDFEDLCRGPHIPSTGVVKAFKIRQVSRSHYRGDVNDQPLQRLYGTAFFKKASLTAYLQQLEEAKKRDHRVIGRELGLFQISESVGSGLVLWLPNGAIIRSELQSFLTAEMVKMGYSLVYTPHVGQLGMYRTSGHFPYYEDSQYPAMFETERGKAIQSTLQLAQRVKGNPTATAKDRTGVTRMASTVQEVWGDIPGLHPEGPLDRVIESLYAALVGEAGYLLRPMNCPHHIQVYASSQRSYRDLPVRLAEYGTVYRYEQSGEVGGLTRVRGFTQDDAHLFCTQDQLAEELLTTVKLTRKVLETLHLKDYRVRVGLRDPHSDKYVGPAENWAKAEEQVRSVARQSGMEFTEEIGEAAFYGPKIDFVVKDCIGRNWQLGTVQADYNQPQRFKLSYVGADNHTHQPVMVHRAPFGSMERFVGILIEHFAGAFPLWLSPIQVGIASVSEKSETYARQVLEVLKAANLRAELDLTSDKIGPKKHRFRAAKVNYILVVGEQEAAGNAVNVNGRDGTTIGTLPLENFVAAAKLEVETKGAKKIGA